MAQIPTNMSLIREILSKALELFSHPAMFQRVENPSFMQNFQNLVQMTSRLQLSDLGTDEQRIELLASKGKAPIFYMPLVDSETEERGPRETSNDVNPPGNLSATQANPASVMTVAAFFLKPQASLPLHDHPKMFGILKLLYGTVTVQSYSSIKCLGTPKGHSIPQMLVHKSDLAHLTPDSPAMVVRRNHDDIHQIWNSGKGVAVFLDILAPPYDFRKWDDSGPSQGHRYVAYYREKGPAPAQIVTDACGQLNVTNDPAKKFVVLEEIPCPDSYCTDHLRYNGPSLL